MDEMEIEEQTEEIPKKIKVSKENFILLGCRGLRNHYDCTKKIGKGGFGKVFQVCNKKTKKLYACKKVSKLNLLAEPPPFATMTKRYSAPSVASMSICAGRLQRVFTSSYMLIGAFCE